MTGSRAARIFVVALALLAPAGLTGGAPVDSDPPLPEVTATRLVPLPPADSLLTTFSPGEELTYAIRYGPMRAGTATLSVVGLEWANGALCYRLQSRIRSSRVFSAFYKVDDLTESWLDARGMFSRRCVRILQEGGYRKNEAVQIDPARGIAVYHPRGDTASVLPRAQDVLSILYFARGLDLEVGQGVIIPSHVDRKNAAVELRVLKRERVTVPAGTFDCGVVEPLLSSAGLFKQEGRLTLWVSDDAFRFPVIMKSKVAVGSIVAVLESYRPGPPGSRPAGGATSGS